VLLLFGMMLLLLAYLDDRLYDADDVRDLSLVGIAHAVPAVAKGKRRG
jgi:hypothetical protein